MRLSRIEPVLRRALRGSLALPAGSRLLVAASGGADSTALLVGLSRVAREVRVELVAAHLHHGLRGAAADQDLAFVRELAARLRIPLTSARWNTRLRMRRRGLAGEAGLRTLRREFLTAAARRVGAVAIATGHTADDQLETVLMRLCRGTGLRGLGGMRARLGIWRKPLLEATRRDIETDLRENGITWREDGSNLDPGMLRNRLRHLVVPTLVRAFDPALDANRSRASLTRKVARAAAEVREAEFALQVETERALSAFCRIQAGEFALDSRGVRSYPLAIRRGVLRRLWKMISPRDPGLMNQHLDPLLRLLERPHAGTIDLPRGFRAVGDGTVVRIGRARRSVASVALAVPGRVRWDHGAISTSWVRREEALSGLSSHGPAVEYFSADGLEGGLEVRAGGADERFVPFGRNAPVRLLEFLSKQRVSVVTRRHPTVLADAGGILWVIGVRRAARAPVTSRSPRVLRVDSERHD